MTAARAKPLANRRFLLVTLPSGPFGRRFASQLRRAGADVLRVVLNGGDLVSWGLTDALWPRVPAPLWRSWLEWQLFERSITDLVVFGDTMAFSAEALACARDNRVRTWVLENGYNRPDWITLEPTGVNAYSCMPRDPRAYRDVDLEPQEDVRHVGSITPFHTVNITSYFTGVVLGGPFFPTYRYPYAVPLWPQIFGHIRRYGARLMRHGRWEREAREVIADSRPFFLACLQREGDSQLIEHSDLKTNAAFMTQVIANFAKTAPRDHRLVFKNHPLDPGVEDLAERCHAIAVRHKIADRVVFLEGGAFAQLARVSKGVVAVNSTAAYAALGFGAPVKLLGRAVFDIDGLTDQRPLEHFWKGPAAPDPDLFARFRHRLSARTQVYGSFHNPRNLTGTAERLVQRLIELARPAPQRIAGPPAMTEIEGDFGRNVTIFAGKRGVASGRPDGGSRSA
ncbi:MAG: capsular biosynthesis protein [Caulobacteraceae bacterium]